MDLVESYFAVAQDLQRQADCFAQSAQLLNDIACKMSEARMRQKATPEGVWNQCEHGASYQPIGWECAECKASAVRTGAPHL